ncbi:MAG: hypothetical protein ACREDS_00905, partial [Limisphaerales bacterium]
MTELNLKGQKYFQTGHKTGKCSFPPNIPSSWSRVAFESFRLVHRFAQIGAHLHATVIPQFYHPHIFGVGYFQIRQSMLGKPLFYRDDLPGRGSAGREYFHGFSLSDPFLHAFQ